MFKTFGNIVKVRRTPDTEQNGTADKVGEIYGETTPSMSLVNVIGRPTRDYAINVFFHDLGTSFWFAEELIETISNGEGTTMTLGDKLYIKSVDGDWIPNDDKHSGPTKKWWQFWKP